MKRFLSIAAILIIGSLAWAQAPAPKKEEPKKKEWYEKIKLGGDFRLRYEGFMQDGKDDRFRERFRLRLKLSAKLSDNTNFTLGLRSGEQDGDPVSDNTTLTGGSNKKFIGIAEAFVDWTPSGLFALHAGKFPINKARINADMEWDDDLNVEGLAESLAFSSGKAPGLAEHRLKVNLFQYVMREQSAANETYLFGLQPYYEMKSDSMSFIIGGSYEEYQNPDALARLTYEKIMGGNPLTNAYTKTADGKFEALKSDFEIVEGFIHFKTGKFGLFGHYFVNNGAYNDEDTAYMLRTSYGGTKDKGGWEVRYTYYYMEAEALFYAYVQSDCTIGTNSESHRFDFTYATTKWSTLGATVYLTDRIEDPTDAYKDLTRFQIDFIVKI
jgi:hypothetical protein